MSTIVCYDAQGRSVPVAADVIIFRPAVYGIFIENNQILLVRNPQTGLWQPPGGILDVHETPTQAVRHHFRQVAGMTPRLGPLLFVEDQYYLDEAEQAWHLSVLYYALERPTATMASLAEIESSAQPDWISLAELERHQLQFGYEAIQAARLQLKL